MIPEKLNDSGDCLCQCPADSNEWCHCNDNPDGTGSSIENPIVVDLVWKEQQKNGSFKYFAVQSGNAKQNLPVVLPTASLTKRGVVQLTNDLSDREDLAVTPKGVSAVKASVDKETAERIANDNEINKRIDKEIADRGNADTALSNRVTTLEQHEANHVTSVVSNGNATVTVTKQNGTTNSFTINNVAHASSADSATKATNADNATNANHAKTADTATKATNADYATNAGHATSADSATKATNADVATKAGTADVALVAKALEGGGSGVSVSATDTPAFTKTEQSYHSLSSLISTSITQYVTLSTPLPSTSSFSILNAYILSGDLGGYASAIGGGLSVESKGVTVKATNTTTLAVTYYMNFRFQGSTGSTGDCLAIISATNLVSRIIYVIA